MSARQSKNGVLTGTMWNIINPSDVFWLIDPINAVLPILNEKLANLAVFLSS